MKKLDYFLKKCVDKFGNKYDYSMVDYKNNNTQISIICPHHGIFHITPKTHLLSPTGCVECSKNKKIEDSISKRMVSRQLNIDKVNDICGISFVNFIGEFENINSFALVKCDKHGIEFNVKLFNLFNGATNCCECNKERTQDMVNKNGGLNKFIIESKKIYGHRDYDYSKVVYVNSKTKVSIGCRIHGFFDVIPNNHLTKGAECSYCTGKLNYNLILNKFEDIINYENGKIILKCDKHGEYEVCRNDLKLKNPCNKCKLEKRDYYSRCLNLGNTSYKYVKNQDWSRSHNFINIECNIHGLFSQSIKAHLCGQGCPFCNSSIGEKTIEKFLLLNNIESVHQFKFEDCRNILPLPFDFYLPEHNICIEFDGIQHFQPVVHFGGDERYEQLQINDGIKNEYCRLNNIELIRIPYYDIDKIPSIIENIKNKDKIK